LYWSKQPIQGAIFIMNKFVICGFASVVMLIHGVASASVLNGVSDNGTDQFGYYYTITGGKFPTGNTPNGDNASGGTFRFLVDDAAEWNRNPAESGVWQKDDWFSDNAGVGLTLRGPGNAIVYDNNGLEPGAASPADPTYYNVVTGNYPTGGHGAHVMYSMSNNFDWIYAGYFKIEVETVITSLTGYFAYAGGVVDALTLGFDPNNPMIGFGMNIWSNVAGDLLPTDTNSFNGDVFTSDATSGAFSWSDTGFDRVGSSSSQDIYRLTYTLAAPLTLAPGEYWFSHDARLVPEPVSFCVWGLLVALGMAAGSRSRRLAD
jgi:hypothetical protein